MTSPFSCSAASSGLPRLFHMSKPSSKWGPSSPGQELLCVSRRKFANLDLLRIRHFEKFDFRSDTHGTGLILGKYQTGNRAIWLVDFLYQPSQELSRVINIFIACSLQSSAFCWVYLYRQRGRLPRHEHIHHDFDTAKPARNFLCNFLINVQRNVEKRLLHLQNWGVTPCKATWATSNDLCRESLGRPATSTPGSAVGQIYKERRMRSRQNA